MKKIGEWLNKPITWKTSIICSLIGMLCSLAWVGYVFGFYEWVGDKITGLVTKIKNITRK
jgi:hypothetical protein